MRLVVSVSALFTSIGALLTSRCAKRLFSIESFHLILRLHHLLISHAHHDERLLFQLKLFYKAVILSRKSLGNFELASYAADLSCGALLSWKSLIALSAFSIF